MQLIDRLYDHFEERACRVKVTGLVLGLSYTAVTTDDGGMGLAFTNTAGGHCCSLSHRYRDYEGGPASELLAEIRSPEPVRRSMGLALVNALNYHDASRCPEDPKNSILMDCFEIGRGTRVAMVGLFKPMMKDFEERGALVEVLDNSRGIGDPAGFREKLDGWADVLLLTSTSILNHSTEDLLACVGGGVKTVMLGPSTPMVAEAFRGLPVHMLAGTLPVDLEGAARAVRHGAGTTVIHRFSRKVYMRLL